MCNINYTITAIIFYPYDAKSKIELTMSLYPKYKITSFKVENQSELLFLLRETFFSSSMTVCVQVCFVQLVHLRLTYL